MENQKIEQYLEIINSIPASLFILEPDGNGNVVYIAFNEVSLKVTQYRESDFKGLTASQLFHGQCGKTIQEHHLQAYHSGEPHTYEITLPINGKATYCRTRLKPQVDEHGRVTHIIGSSQAIIKKNVLAATQSKANPIENELQDFVYLAAHDMRSPIRRIAMLADAVQEDFQDTGDGKLEALEIMKQVTEQTLNMVNQVLEHAQTTSIEESTSKECLPAICQIIRSTLDPQEEHLFSIKECSFEGDCTLLQIILRNLIDNAIKHNSSTGEQLEIAISANGERSGFSSFTVIDNGQGMLDPHSLFQSNAMAHSKSGFGLLAIQKLLRARGGDIFGTPAQGGKGLSVTLYLPGTINFSDPENPALKVSAA